MKFATVFSRLKFVCRVIHVVRKQHNTGSKHKTFKTSYDAIIVGGGHNGLVAAAYLQKSGLDVCVLERRHVIGGAAVTEEIVPGFKFSRASYVLSLLRPQIVKDLELKKYGLKVYLRNPSSYTPLLEPGGKDRKAHSLCLGPDAEQNKKQISQFSDRDAQAFEEYEQQLKRIVSAMDILLDSPPISWTSLLSSSLSTKWQAIPAVRALISAVLKIGKDMPAFYELMTASSQKVLNRWFESEPLRATLATDSVVGTMTSPVISGSAYVLLHHVMGELEGIKGAWGYVEGGMGNVSHAIKNCAVDHGADVFCDKPVTQITLKEDHATGVVLEDGTEIKSRVVLSNATPKVTYLNLLPQNALPQKVTQSLEQYDYTSPVTKINLALDCLPSFLADPNLQKNEPMPHHQCSIHLNCENMQMIHEAFLDAQRGLLPSRPMIEMVIPSSRDPTLAPPGKHVASLFTQFTPYTLAKGAVWDEETRNKYASIVFDAIENYAPGFKASIIGCDILTPPDLERIFGLTGGNIFHGTMSLDQLYFSRPIPSLGNYRGPIVGLYLCGSGSHPGGGVMGSAGRLAAQAVLADIKHLRKY
ncbi:pyridine nucleotide-disulfide oxidoreductase domain-containing protein 2-like isoform X2 [Pomacea canaliculata]|uniref:pyridine nucleotide-disulfide oxidoreductase domain-containing protein 2-like isoform X2 n=1 Tax=Pomacea canaliculata TaxID=400727 RepID=UPI000D73B87E|nr:pyridine nucleotide-disulfide oxidoreductase domain-containing protein 2-like isoform X2 [Pomacea canaliculata]XP_025095772.1 pyridine nucleotide-disulfide oxidoreductase domain-containing protein 2-like isoform X2 [Pomacea canaliculata]XP_025095774.1 pyridine nucleotide-disulfide oxidoreductase domain-containing protein 2-like isoform X2 [Pomacea canaliculata]XP_025095775.1 pyridine nucleotide-disulfide oxidoreductase domain-containing protein 2-like isoform X2 [Pomacea canaliculata]